MHEATHRSTAFYPKTEYPTQKVQSACVTKDWVTLFSVADASMTEVARQIVLSIFIINKISGYI